MAEFLTIGEPLVVLASDEVDVTLDKVQRFSKYIAGAELNVAIGMSRLGHSVSYISKVGEDPFGKFIIDKANEAGIDTRFLIKSKMPTGFYLKEKVSQGDPAVAYFRKNSAASQLTTDEIKSINTEGAKIAHLSGIFPALSETALETFKGFNEKLNESGILTVFDPNLRPKLWDSTETMIQTINQLAKNSQIILPGISEGKILVGSKEPEKIADFYLLQSNLTHTVVVKLGAAGAFVKTKSGEKFTIQGFKVRNVADTVGAGDGFAVGLESALIEGKSLKEAVKRACAVGALAVQSFGDSDGYPTSDELRVFYEENGEN